MNPLINQLARNGKFRWYKILRKNINMSTSSTNANSVLIGDSASDFYKRLIMIH